MRAFAKALTEIVLLCAAVQTAAAQITSVRIARATTEADLRLTMEGEDEFLTTDPSVQYRVTYNTQGGDRLRIEFWDPAGKLAQRTDDPPLPRGAPGTYWIMRIAGSQHEFQPGEWQVRTYWNDGLVNVTKFRISLPPDSPIKFLTSTVLTSGTVGQPYHLQLTAAGGTPRYRWTAVKALPAGLTLSPEGVITGTPQERGGFRAVVKAEDSAGSSVTRSVGISVGSLAEGVQVLSRSLLKATGTDACSGDNAQTDFAVSDTGIALSARVDGDKRPVAVEWLNPRGEVAQRYDVRKSLDGPECFVNTLALAGHPAASDPGNWRVRLLWRSNEVFTLKFTVSEESRVAFLIENRAYQKLPAAGTPDGDVRRIETALRGDGFRVNEKTNLTLADLAAFEKSLGQTVHPGDTVFVYYTGHEIPSGGDAWLAPVNFDPADPRPIQSKAYSVQRLRDVLEDAKAKLQFIVLDASRQGNGKGLDASAADATTAIVQLQSAGGHSGGFARALADILSRRGTDARTAFEVDLPKAYATIEPSAQRPVVFLGGAGSFIFRTSADPRP